MAFSQCADVLGREKPHVAGLGLLDELRRGAKTRSCRDSSSRYAFSMHTEPSRKDSLLNRITIDPAICHGKPTIRGLRYPVESMLEYLAGGDSFEEVLAEFPDLERDDLLACLQFAAQSLKLRSQHIVAA